VNVEGARSGYQSNDGLLKMAVSHTYNKRTRRVIRIDLTKVAPNPLISAENIIYTTGLYLVSDEPPTGIFTVAERLAMYTGFNTQLTASSNAVLTKFFGGES
jgi:hypothetical protein